jgi:hypothetical protein
MNHHNSSHRWASRCSPSQRLQPASRCARTASSKEARRNRKITRRSGKCSVLFLLTLKITSLEGLYHWVWSPLQRRDRPSSTTVLCSRHAKLSLRLIRANLSKSTRTLTASVSWLPLPSAFRLPLSLTTPDPGHRPRVVYADAPCGHRERGREARLHILAERPHRASTRCVRSWKGGLPPTERRAQPRPRAPGRGKNVRRSIRSCTLIQKLTRT